MKRFVTAIVAASLVAASVWGLPTGSFFFVCLVLFEVAAVEFVQLGRRIHPGTTLLLLPTWLAVVAGLPIVVPAAQTLALVALASSPLLFALLILRSRSAPRATASALSWLSFGLPFLVLPIWCLVELHRVNPALLLVCLLAIWSNDSVAFLAGSSFGRHKLAPLLSPNKTWEGAVAGLAAATIVGTSGVAWIGGRVTLSLVGVFALVALAAQAGDLIESLLKRAAGVKDSGTLFPGHGGALDRLDAIILGVPVFYALLRGSGQGFQI